MQALILLAIVGRPDTVLSWTQGPFRIMRVLQLLVQFHLSILIEAVSLGNRSINVR